jgi:hypothetical protein
MRRQLKPTLASRYSVWVVHLLPVALPVFDSVTRMYPRCTVQVGIGSFMSFLAIGREVGCAVPRIAAGFAADL